MIFLRHDVDLKPTEVRLSEKIANTIAIVASTPPNHPLYHYYDHSRKTKPRAHKGSLHASFQSNLADIFKRFEDIQQPDSTKPLPLTPNFGGLIIPEKGKAVKSIQALKPSTTHFIIYSDGSKIEGKNTAAAWCENSGHCSTHKLGHESEYGIFKAEYMGFILALQLMKQSFQVTTRTVNIILDNQGVVKDLAKKKTSSRALSHKITATEHIRKVWTIAPHVKISLRWCPGHQGIIGNKTADKLANVAAKKPVPPSHIDKSTAKKPLGLG